MSTNGRASGEASTEARMVWDFPLRAAHWLLVLTVAGAWATHYAGTRWFTWHRWLGYATLVLVVFRITWGFIGTRHARFSSFVPGPAGLVAYFRGQPPRTAPGHSPLGALSVLAMLAALLFQAATGLFANDEIASAGPFYGWIAPGTSNRITSLHEANSNLVLGLVVLHLCAVAWYVRMAGRPLVRAMLTGKKPASEVAPGDAIAGSRTLLALAVVAMLALALALVVRAAPESVIALY